VRPELTHEYLMSIPSKPRRTTANEREWLSLAVRRKIHTARMGLYDFIPEDEWAEGLASCKDRLDAYDKLTLERETREKK